MEFQVLPACQAQNWLVDLLRKSTCSMLPKCKIALACRPDAYFQDTSTLKKITRKCVHFCTILEASNWKNMRLVQAPRKLAKMGIRKSFLFSELKHRENQLLACTRARSCSLVASKMLIFSKSRQVHFGPGMLVKLEISWFLCKHE